MSPRCYPWRKNGASTYRENQLKSKHCLNKYALDQTCACRECSPDLEIGREEYFHEKGSKDAAANLGRDEEDCAESRHRASHCHC
jgi:hypothetical protein